MLLWLGQTVSNLGTWINFVGLTLYVYQIFGSGKILGMFMVVRMLPALLFGSLGGYLADRYSTKKIMITCDILRGIFVLAFLFTKNIYAFFAIGLILSALDKIFTASRCALVPAIVEKDQLMEANSLTRMTHSIIMIIGPAVGGLLVSLLSYKSVFIIDAATFAVSFISLSFITRYKPADKKGKSGSFIDEFKATFLFVQGQFILIFMTTLRILDATGSGAYNVALPILSKTYTLKKGSSYGWLVGAWALGEFTGSIIVNHLSKKLKIAQETIFSISIILMAAGMGMTFRTGNLYYSLLAIYFGGMGDGISGVLYNTTLMKESPADMRGKIFGTTTALQVTGVAAGMAVSGFFLDKFPLSQITDTCSLVIVVGTVIGYVVYLLRGKGKLER